jgi:hypothetical protein
MTPEMQALNEAASDAWGYALFCFVFLGLVAWTVMMMLFAALFVRSAWRWLTRHTMNDVVRSMERRALRQR